MDARCARTLGFAVASPRDAERSRGSQVSLTHAAAGGASHGYAIMQALIARGVIGDFRAGGTAPPTPERPHAPPDILQLRLHAAVPARFVDVWDAVDHLVQVMASGRISGARARFNQRAGGDVNFEADPRRLRQ